MVTWVMLCCSLAEAAALASGCKALSLLVAWLTRVLIGD